MIYDFMELTWLEIEALKKNKLALVLPIAPIEEHGTHLPLGVDCFLTESWVDECLSCVEGYDWVKVPIQTVGCADIKGFVGNMHISQNTLCQYVYELLNNYASWGIQNIIIISGHADPKHAIAIEKACSKVNKKYGLRCFAPMGAIFSGDHGSVKQIYTQELKEMLEEFPNDFHAGWIETSIMLHLMENKVKGNYLELEATLIKAKDMIFPKRVNRIIENKGHIGYPNLATKHLGELLQKDMVDRLSDCVSKFLNRKEYEPYEHHFLYKIKFLHPKRIREVK